MKRLLAIGDGVAPTGLARALQEILRHLSAGEWDIHIHHLALNYFGDPHPLPWKVYPTRTGGDVHGVRRMPDLIQRLKPDVLLFLIDPWVIAEHLKALEELKSPWRPKVSALFLLEAEGGREAWYERQEMVDVPVTVTGYARSLLPEALGRRTEVIPLGVDREKFFPLDRRETKAGLGLDPEGFVVLNANRNQARKRVDLTLAAFARFARQLPENVQLYLHMGIEDTGWDVVELARRYGMEDRLVLSPQSELGVPRLEDADMLRLYNACDVGISTSCAEAWGLAAFEHAATGAPQLLPDLPTLRATWQEAAEFLPIDKEVVLERHLFTSRLVSVEGAAAALQCMYRDPERRKRVGLACQEVVRSPAYAWSDIGRQWDSLLKRIA